MQDNSRPQTADRSGGQKEKTRGLVVVDHAMLRASTGWRSAITKAKVRVAVSSWRWHVCLCVDGEMRGRATLLLFVIVNSRYHTVTPTLTLSHFLTPLPTLSTLLTEQLT